MVNIGKPSTGCQTCRLRRIKCDERKPACYKCEIAKRQCLGYRDENELRFISRNLRKEHLGKGRAQPHFVAIEPAYHTLLPPPSMDLDDMVMSSYMVNFVNAKAKERDLGIVDSALGPLLDVIGPVCARSSVTGPSYPAILAMAWATTMPFAGAQYSMQQARIKYMEAISRLKVAVDHPVAARSDDTLLAVLLVGWVEVITSTAKSIPQVGKHIAGAIAIVNLRGKQNFSSQRAKRMLAFVKLRLSINPVITTPTLPPYRSLSPEILRYDAENSEISDDPKDAPLRLGDLALQICSLQEEAVNISSVTSYTFGTKGIDSILKRSMTMNQKFLDWHSTLPPEWEISSPQSRHDQSDASTMSSTSHTKFYMSHVLTYPTLHIAEMYNQYRLHRVKNQVIIMKCASKIASSLQAQSHEYVQASAIYKAAHRVCLDIVNDICATVPIHFGKKPPHDGGPSLQCSIIGSQGHQLPTPSDTRMQQRNPATALSLKSTTAAALLSGRETQQPTLRKNMGYYMLLQPLLFAQAVVGVPDEQREWVMDQAKEICQRTGMDEPMIRMRFERMRMEWKRGFDPLDRHSGVVYA